MPIELAKHPETNPKLLVRSLQLYWASLIHVFGLALFLGFIFWISRIVTSRLFVYQAHLVYIDIFVFLSSVLIMFVFITILWRMRCVMTHTHDSILDDISIASKKIFLIVGAAVIQLMLFTIVSNAVYALSLLFQGQSPVFTFYLTMVLFCILFLVLLYFYFALIFYLPLILTENKGIFPAMIKSIALVWKNWWRVFLLQIIPIISYMIVITILSAVFHINFKMYFSELPTYIVATVVNLFVLALFIPFNGAVLLIQLRDLELRKEKVLAREVPSATM